jgi:hypothetical protein
MEATWATAIPAISVCLFGPGKVWTNEPAALTGTVVGGCWAGSGSMYRAVSGIMVPAGDRLRLLHLLWIAVVDSASRRIPFPSLSSSLEPES